MNKSNIFCVIICHIINFKVKSFEFNQDMLSEDCECYRNY